MAKIALAAAEVAAGIGLLFVPGGESFGVGLILSGGMGLLGDLIGGHTKGPRLGHSRVTTATDGVPIPFGYGVFRFAGNIIWSAGIKEHQQTQSLKGGPSATTYTYTASFACSFGEGPGTIKRIWADSKVIYDPSVYNSKYPAPTLYPGTQTQNPDPTIQAAEGSANTPAFRGMIYCVWEDFPLQNFGNRIPNLRAEIDYGQVTLDGIVADLCERSGLTASQIDVSQLTTWSGIHDAGSAQIPRVVQKKFFKYTTDIYGDITVGFDIPATPGNTLILMISGYQAAGQNLLPPAFTGGQSSGYDPDRVAAAKRIAIAGDQNFSWSTLAPSEIYNVALYEIAGQPTIGFQVGLITPGNSAQASGYSVAGPALVLYQFAWYNNVQVKPDAQGNDVEPAPPYTVEELYPITDHAEAAIVAASGTSVPNSNVTIEFTGTTDSNGTAYVAVIVNGWTTVPFGYVISREISGADALRNLAGGFFFDGRESGGILQFIPRGGSSVMTIVEDDLGLEKDKAKLQAQIGQEQDLPRAVSVMYTDPALDYQQNKQGRKRKTKTVKTKQKSEIYLPFAIDATTARQIAERTLYLAYLERKEFDLNLWKSLYLLLDPADVVQFVYEGITYQARIVKGAIGANYGVQIKAVSENSNVYTSTTPGGTTEGYIMAGGQAAVPTTFYVLELPYLTDSDANPSGTGLYFFMFGGPGWPGGVLYESTDDTSADFVQDGQSGTSANYGTASNTLGAPASFGAWDTVNTLTVAFNGSGSFVSRTAAEVLAGAQNALLVGSEVIQFQTATHNGDGTWTFSTLLRGRRGTDWDMGSHGASELVVDLSGGGMVRVDVGSGAIGQTRYYRGVTVGGDVSAITSKTLALAGVDLKPYSPVAIGGSVDGSGNITIQWLRRTRYGGKYGTGNEALIDGVGGPVNEATESYEVDIMSGNTVKRTLKTNVPTAVYSASMQTADFGALQTSVNVKVYQISATVGRGYAGAGTSPATTDAPAVSGGGGSFYINNS